jgi:flagellar hook-basal body complex protein FliE
MLTQTIVPISLQRLEPIVKNEPEKADAQNSFGQFLRDALTEVNRVQQESAELDKQLAAGTLENVHQAMIATEKATLALEATIQVRNKVIEAYQEIMRTQF